MAKTAHPLGRDEQVHAITVFAGWATADGLAGGTTIVDTKLIGSNDFLAGKAVLIMSGPCAWEMKVATSFVPGTGVITLPAFSAQITAGTLYRILTSGAGGGAVDLTPVITILGSPVRSIDLMLGARWDGAGDLGTDIANIIAAIGGAGVSVFTEQADNPVTINAVNGSETNVLLLNTANTRYLVRSLRLKCANPGANIVTVRLYELINDVLLEVDSFEIDSTNFAYYHSMMDMFGLSNLAGTQLSVTVRASAGGPYAVTGQYSASKAAI
jgi:hypothetical protein